MPRPPERSSSRARPFTIAGIAGIVAAACALVVSVAFAAPSKPVAITDAGDDVGGPLDMTRISLRRAPDGRLRAALTFAAGLTPKDLLASSGPPGSACVRIWTKDDADPKATPPDRLVCVTARARDELRGGVYEVLGEALPKRLSDASVRRDVNGRGIVLRFTQSSLGRPERIRFAVESTRPGCERPSCIDTVPNKGAVRVFRLR
jgi:hypothetical protein